MQSESCTVARGLEHAPPTKQIAIMQIVLYLLSFCVTWYKVWWDTLFGLFVAIGGYYALHNTNSTPQPNMRYVEYFHYGSVVSMAVHVIAFSAAIYFMVSTHLFNNVIGLAAFNSDGATWTFDAFLMIFICAEIIATALAIQRSSNLLAELRGSDCYFEFTRGNEV